MVELELVLQGVEQHAHLGAHDDGMLGAPGIAGPELLVGFHGGRGAEELAGCLEPVAGTCRRHPG